MKNNKIVNIVLIACLLGGVSACSSSDKDNNTKHTNQSAPDNNANNSNKDDSDKTSDSASKFDVNAQSLSYSKYKFASSATSLAPIRTDPIWAGKGGYVASTNNVIVSDDNGVYYGLDLANGKQLWKLDSSGKDIPGVKDITNPTVTTKDVGDKLLVVWSGQVGGDALNEAKTKTYAKSYSIDTGKVLQEKEYDSEINVSPYGTGYFLNNGTSNENNNNVFFANSGFTTLDTKNFDSFLSKHFTGSGGANSYSLRRDPIMLNSKYAAVQLLQYPSDNNYIQIFDTKSNNAVSGPIKVPENYKGYDNIDTYSPNLNYIVMSGILLDINDPSKSHAVVDDSTKAKISYESVSDNGEVLGTAAATGPEKWVLVKDKTTKILDDTNNSNRGENTIDFNDKYIIHGAESSYTNPSTNETWRGNFVIFNRKN